MLKKIISLMLILFYFVIFLTAQDIEKIISFQGKLFDSAGKIVNGTKNITIKLYSLETGGTALWSEVHNNVNIQDGIFNLDLGSLVSFNINFDTQYWLGITIESEPEMLPRRKLKLSPYALHSFTSDTAYNILFQNVIGDTISKTEVTNLVTNYESRIINLESDSEYTENRLQNTENFIINMDDTYYTEIEINDTLSFKRNIFDVISADSIGEGTVNDTEFSYLNGLTSSIQSQLNLKTDNTSPVFNTSLMVNTGNITINNAGPVISLKTTDDSVWNQIYFHDSSDVVKSAITYRGDVNQFILRKFNSALTTYQTFYDTAITLNGGNIGIGTENPSDSLTVKGTVYAETMTIRDTVYASAFIGDGSGLTGISAGGNGWTDGGSNIYLTSATDKVGIGTTSPSYLLDLYGITATERILSSSGSSQLYINGSSSSDSARIYLGYNGASTKWAIIGDMSLLKIGATTAATGITLNSTGNLGVGVTNPTAKLSVSELIQVQGDASPQWATSGAGVEIGYDTDDVAGEVTGRGVLQSVDRDAGMNKSLRIGANDIELLTGITGSGTERMRITNSGNIGIGTASPSDSLTVNGSVSVDTITVIQTIYANSFIGDGSGLTGINFGKFSGNVNDSIYITGTNVGIGTNSPLNKLHILNGTSGAIYTSADMVIEDDDDVWLSLLSPNNVTGRIIFGDPESPIVGQIIYDHTLDYMRFRVAGVDRFSILNSGNIGIGITTPSDSLSVAGPIGIIGKGKAVGGLLNKEVMAYFKNDDSTNNSAILVDASNGKDAFLMFSENGNPVWDLRNNFSNDSSFQIREQIGLANLIRVNIASNSGNVGIGVTSPLDKLHISGGLILGNTTNLNAGTIKWDGTNFLGYDGSSWKALDVQGSSSAGGWTDDGDTVRLSTGIDRIGIGTNSPEASVHIYGSNAPDFMIQETGAGSSAQFSLRNPSREWWIEGDASPDIFSITNKILGKGFVIDGTTNFVGIGTETPPVKLTVAGPISVANGQGNGYKIMKFDGSPADVLDLGTNDAMRLKVPGTELYINPDKISNTFINYNQGGAGNILMNCGTSTGNVGIGAILPAAKFHVKGSIIAGDTYGDAIILEDSTSGPYLVVSQGIMPNAGSTLIQASNGGTGNDLMNLKNNTSTVFIVKSNGNVGVGNDTPLEKLDIQGKVLIKNPTNDNNNDAIYGIPNNSSQLILQPQYLSTLYDPIILYSQFGINTATRTYGAFGIRKKRTDDNWHTDFLISETGNIGFGNIFPTNKLHLEKNGGIQLDALTYGFVLEPITSTSDYLNIRSVDSGTNTTNVNNILTITRTGNVGIGTGVPERAKLVVSGNVVFDNGVYGYLSSLGTTDTASGSVHTSIYASERIVASEFNAFSDSRIKQIISLTDSDKDLENLKKLQVTNYKYIDSKVKGNEIHKKFIAQQIEEVYPQAVNRTTDFIPNVYQLTDQILFDNKKSELTIFLSKKHNFIKNDKVKLITKNGISTKNILKVLDEYTFVVDSDVGYKKIFVFGKEVSDFKVIDYEALTALNISATQELIKKITKLEKENLKLKELNDYMNKKISDFNKRLEKLELK